MQHTRLHPIQHPMRTTLSRSLVLALASIALISSAFLSQAQDAVLLQMTNSNWRYFQGTAEPPNVNNINWRATNYSDAAWSGPGPGVFGLEDANVLPPGAAIRTPLNLTQPGATAQTLSYYFRTTFNYSQSPSGVELIFTNIIDDGAVVYLNGTEIYRYRITGTPTYSTLAAGGTEGIFELNNIVNSPWLRQGNNVLAVEVHQSSATSSDIVFGLGLLARRLTPITITKQPESQVLAVGDPLSLSVEVAGSNPVFQWFRNGVAVGGATSSNYNTTASLANAGTYFVRVSNAVSTNNSDQVSIQVVADTFGPEPILAVVEENETNIVTITFDDSILRIHSKSKVISNTVDVVNDRLTVTDHEITPATDLSNVQPVTVSNSGGSLPGGLSGNTTYYAYVVNGNTLSLHTTAQGGLDGVNNRVNLTSNGTNLNTLQYGKKIHDAINTNNYRVQIVGTPSTPIEIQAAAASGIRVRLTLGSGFTWDRSKEYYITLNNLMDSDFNLIKPNTQIGVNFRLNTNLVHYSRTWKWTGMWESNLPPSWTSLDYVESPDQWFEGAGPLYFEPDGNDTTCMGPLYNGIGNGTEIANFYNSYYFRQKFIVPTNFNLAETTVRLVYVLDDGAVFYINGVEVYRTNMPAGPVAFNTVASSSWEPGDPAQGCRSNSLPATVLRPGTNIMAVQVFQGPNPNAEAYDIAFGVNVDFSTTYGFDVPALSYRRLPPLVGGGAPRLAVDWPGSGWTLQQSSTASTNGPWTTATSTGNSYTNTTGARFFRLRKN
jgi:hypothetical protein